MSKDVPGAIGSFDLSILPLLRSSMSFARCFAIAPPSISLGCSHDSAGVSMRVIDFSLCMTDASRGRSVVDGPVGADVSL